MNAPCKPPLDKETRVVERCPCCGMGVVPSAIGRCPACGLKWNLVAPDLTTRNPEDVEDPVAQLQRRLLQGEVQIQAPNADWPLPCCFPSCRWTMSPRALLHAMQRCRAWSPDLQVSGWRQRLPVIRCRIRQDEAPAYSQGVCLVTLMCARDMQQAVQRVQELLPSFADAVVMFDGSSLPSLVQHVAAMSNARVAARALRGDYAAQRNAAVAMAASDWVLHLDGDEVPSEGLLKSLPRWIAFAERHGFRVLGVPRRNYVDGVLSPVYPDYQYRLHHRKEKWVRPVHEVPRSRICSWRRVWDLPADGDAYIQHFLDKRGLAEKAAFYEKLNPGAGRIEGIQKNLGDIA